MVELKQNILYVTRRGLYLHHEKEALKVKDHAETVLSVPMHHLEGVTLFGVSTLTPSLLSKCLQRGVFVSYLSERGRFLGRLEGAKSGNVLVRLDQVRKSFDSNERVRLSR
ncbi:MAG: CRISPR-associated endonuclease Cas1, partial [Leptospiraceae bacterium]|nr:CRISPR-associated endonuclease Cas1 [Leptospiraceae bacterium]